MRVLGMGDIGIVAHRLLSCNRAMICISIPRTFRLKSLELTAHEAFREAETMLSTTCGAAFSSIETIHLV